MYIYDLLLNLMNYSKDMLYNVDTAIESSSIGTFYSNYQ